MILVTGANGQLGRRIVQHLIAREPSLLDGRLGVSVRDVARATELARRGVIVRRADFDQPDSLATAFAGIRRLVLVSTDGPGAGRSARHRRAINAALAAGVSHILYTSFLDADADSPSGFALAHQETEAALAHSGVAHTVLRNTFYADDLRQLAEPALAEGVLRLPAGTGRVSLVSRDELAQAIAAAALAPRLDKRVYELTGQAALGYADIATRIARVSGRPLAYEAVSVEAYTGSLVAQGAPGWFASALAELFVSVAAGRLAAVSHDFAALVGHPPKSLDCLIHEYFAPRSPA
ncbi:SDR family oxidoreductase [Zoogloea sp.]|uniref:SDR family oxidoreductase n=1 Tax=Zoogloea sp. TaxID=49181 RepID=UPI001AC3EA59|nr:SDR family oxidoreductase [Zoogloea sp.]MBN8285604.1 SDR family oxidoreductase [Zoogloea sp.]